MIELDKEILKDVYGNSKNKKPYIEIELTFNQVIDIASHIYFNNKIFRERAEFILEEQASISVN